MDVWMIGSYPPRRCGIGDYTADLCKAITKTRIARIRVVTYRDGMSQEECLPPGILVARVLPRKMSSKQADRLLRNSQPDLLHVQSSTFLHHPSVNAAIATSFKGPMVVTVHDTPRSWRLFYTIPSLRRLYSRATRIIVHSKDVGKVLADFHGVDQGKLVTMPHGVETSVYRPDESSDRVRTQYGLGDKRIVLFFGFLRPQKGLEVLLKAWALVEGEHRDSVLVIAGGAPSRPRRYRLFAKGEGTYPERLKELAGDLGVTDRVIFTDYVPQDYVPELMAEAEIVTLPYQGRVSQSGPLHKALSAGKPVIATRLAGFQEVFEEDGDAVWFDPGDAASLAEAISSLLDDPETAHDIGRRGRHHAVNRLDWEKVARQTLACYSSVLDAE